MYMFFFNIAASCIRHITEYTLFPFRHFRSPLSAEFWRHCVMSGESPRALSRYQSEKMKILNALFPGVVIEPTTYRVYSSTLAHLRHNWPLNNRTLVNKNIYLNVVYARLVLRLFERYGRCQGAHRARDCLK